MERGLTVEALVDSKQVQQVGRDLVRRGAAGLLPEEGVKVVCLAQDRALADIKCLCEGFQMEQPPCKLKVRVSDRSSRVRVSDEEDRNVWGPASVGATPEAGSKPLLGREMGSGEPDATRAFS